MYRSAMQESGDESDPYAFCTHAKPAGPVVRCSNVSRNLPLSDLYTPRHNLQSAGRVAVRHTLELVETLHDHRHPLTATNTYCLWPVYAESGPLNRAEPHITAPMGAIQRGKLPYISPVMRS